jgi:PAS domain S-box-containing protein
VLVSDRDGRYVEANPAICRMLGYSRDELLAMSSPGLIAVDDPLTPREMDERLAEARAGPGLLVERRYRRRDGTSLPAEVTFTQLADGGLLRTIRDISQRIHADAERTRLVSAVEQTADAIWMQDIAKVVTYVNPAFTRIYGYEAHEIVGQHARIVDSRRQDRAFFEAIWASVLAGRTWTGLMVNRHRDGRLIELEAVISAIRDAQGQLVGYVQADRDVTHERELERALERDARERETITAALARIDPAGSAEAIAAAACEVIGGLPGVDSTWAAAIDEVEGAVLAAAGRLAAAFPPGRIIPASRAEYLRDRGTGGPWVEVWRARSEDRTWAEAVTSTGLRAMAYAPLRSARGVVGVVGIGSHDPATAQSLVEHVPALATFASILGAQLVPKLEVRHREAEARTSIEGVLRDAAFRPWFQPIVDTRAGDVVGYEALSRFDDGVQPDVRFREAARVGLGVELELATLRAAIDTSTVLPPDAYLSLNASPDLIHSGALDGLLAGIPRPIVLEITEHVAIDDYPALRRDLAALGSTVRLAVDDAGAGYASFRHILELNPDLVKLDIGLVRAIDADPARQALLAGMAYFGIKRKLRLVAEGIESWAELRTIRSLGIGYGQGYLLGRPQDSRGPDPWPTRVAVTEPDREVT